MQDKHKALNLGKLPADHLAHLLSRLSPKDPRVILGPSVGEDAAVLDMGDRYLIAKSDPITFATDAIGWYAVHINANDVACAGAAPRWFLSTLLLPEDRADVEMVDAIFSQIVDACEEIGATLIGGHTEITYGIDRPIVIGSMLGEVEPKRLVTTGGVQPGDIVLFTQRVAVEATAIIAREKRDQLTRELGFSHDLIERCADFIYHPGISVVRAAQTAAAHGDIHAMHDPTEGGLATGLWEMAVAAGVSVEIDLPSVPVYPETRMLCDAFGLDPFGTIASGSLLLTLSEADVKPVCDALTRAGIEVSVIGRALARDREVTVTLRNSHASDQRSRQAHERAGIAQQPASLRRFQRDEIARLFE